VLANIAATVDRISNGRLVLGIGAGWQENEHAVYGLRLGSVAERLDRFEEACQVLTLLLREPRTTFDGRYYRVEDAPNQPAPVQDRLPLLVGGGGERRTMRIAARYADEWNAWTTPESLASKVEILRRHCAEIGRDPGELRISTQAPLLLSDDDRWLAGRRATYDGIVGNPAEVIDIIESYRQAGLDELIVPDISLGDTLSHRKETCDLFIEEVAPHFAE
jgi:alkanesulfonate monooxygenase SsuD/methylene tetrahydromethanopterin reductase-like flavin-dependent oxidoreductase (luciferase family)